jgi:hypothetical protein
MSVSLIYSTVTERQLFLYVRDTGNLNGHFAGATFSKLRRMKMVMETCVNGGSEGIG